MSLKSIYISLFLFLTLSVSGQINTEMVTSTAGGEGTSGSNNWQWTLGEGITLGNSFGTSGFNQPLTVLAGDTIFVDISAPANGGGTSWGDAYDTFQEAVDLVNSDPSKQYIILVAEGVYTSNNSSEFQFTNGAYVLGGYPAGGASFDSRAFWNNETKFMSTVGNPGHIIGATDLASEDTLIINGVTIDGSNASEIGIVVKNSNVTIESSIITNTGGAIVFNTDASGTAGFTFNLFSSVVSEYVFMGGPAAIYFSDESAFEDYFNMSHVTMHSYNYPSGSTGFGVNAFNGGENSARITLEHSVLYNSNGLGDANQINHVTFEGVDVVGGHVQTEFLVMGENQNGINYFPTSTGTEELMNAISPFVDAVNSTDLSPTNFLPVVSQPTGLLNYNVPFFDVYGNSIGDPVQGALRQASACNPLLVTTDQDDGTCGTLRYALEYLNDNAISDTIRFTPAMDTRTITLDQLKGSLIASQSGIYIYGDREDDGKPNVSITGEVDFTHSLLSVSGGDITVQGLNFQNIDAGDLNDALLLISSDDNLVFASSFGTDLAGSVSVAGGTSVPGIRIDGGVGNQIGGGQDSTNVISGNSGPGILLTNAANNNEIYGNIVGLNASQTSAIPNALGGVVLLNANNNIIGGVANNRGNVLSGNTGSGIRLSELNTSDNIVLSNYIGINSAQDTPFGNTESGVLIENTAHDNNIGNGFTTGANIIGENPYGISINGVGTDYNAIRHNFIGTNNAGLDLGNTDRGISITDGAQFNNIGGSGATEGNIIGFNQYGVYFGSGGASNINNTLENNFIGTNFAGLNLGNTAIGIRMGEARFTKTINNTIAFNANYGIRYSNNASNNIHIGDTIYSNGTLGILINSSSEQNNIQKPVIDPVTSLTITGTFDGVAGDTVQLYADAGNQGRLLIGDATTGSGTWTYTLLQQDTLDMDALSLDSLTAIQTVGGNSSEFSDAVLFEICDSPLLVSLTTDNNVIGTGTDGECGDLRYAVNYLNNNGGNGTITFGISNTQIDLVEELLVETSNVIIDGETNNITIATIAAFEGGKVFEVLTGGSGFELLNISLDGSATHVDSLLKGISIDADSVLVDNVNVTGFGEIGIHVNEKETIIRNVTVTNSGLLGVLFENNTDTTSVLIGSRIGVESDGTTPNGNKFGVIVYQSSAKIGDVGLANSNIISSNDSAGIILLSGNSVVYNNYIGLDINDAASPNGVAGIILTGAYNVGPNNISGEISQNNIIGNGLASGRNMISGNDGNGVLLSGANTSFNKINDNYIGINSSGIDVGNAKSGITLANDASQNRLEYNIIANNDSTGLAYLSGATNNVHYYNTIYNNELKGIYIGGANQESIEKPVITNFNGTLISGTHDGADTVQVFADDSSQGNFFLGNANVIDGTSWEYTLTSVNIDSIVARGLDSLTAISTETSAPTGNSSEFSEAFPYNIIQPAPSNICAHSLQNYLIDLEWAKIPSHTVATQYTVTYTSDTVNGPFTNLTPALGDTSLLAQDLSAEADNLLFFAVSAGGDTSNFTGVVPVIEAGNALSFDGTSQYIDAGSDVGLPDNGEAVTLEAWINPNTFSLLNPIIQYGRFIGGSKNTVRLQLTSTGQLQVSQNATSAGSIITSNDIVQLNEWTHVAFTYPGGNANLSASKLFINGESISFTSSGVPVVNTIEGGNLFIGYSDNETTQRYFSGSIDEVRIWSEARNSFEIDFAKDFPMTGNEFNLAGLWHLDEPTGGIAYNATCLGSNGVWINNPAAVPSKAMHPFSDTLIAQVNATGDTVSLIWNTNIATDIASYAVYELQSVVADTAGNFLQYVFSPDTTVEIGYTGTCDTLWYAVFGVDNTGQVGDTLFVDSTIVCPSCNPLLVTSTADDSTCGTLRAAIGYAIDNNGRDRIEFDPALDGLSILLTKQLPDISIAGVKINADLDNDGEPNIYIDMTATSDYIVRLLGDSIAIEGLGFVTSGGLNNAFLFASGDSVDIISNTFGTTLDGNSLSGAGSIPQYGIHLTSSSFGRVGTLGKGNVVGVANLDAILLQSSNGNSIQSNIIGVSRDLDTELNIATADGIDIGGNNNIIGGLVTGEENVIGGITGNRYAMVLIVGSENNYVLGNYLGVDPAETIDYNIGNGLSIGGGNNIVGGLGDSSNVIKNAISNSILNLAGVNNLFSKNSIYNGTNGVLLGFGGNYETQAPVITTVQPDSNVIGTSNSVLGDIIHVYADAGSQGRLRLGQTTTEVDGSWSYKITPQNITDISAVGGLDSVTAVRDSSMNSSPFSNAIFLEFCDPLLVTSVSDDSICGTLRYAIGYANTNLGADTILFANTMEIILSDELIITGVNGSGTYIKGDIDSDGDPDIQIEGSGFDIITVENATATIIEGLALGGAADGILLKTGSDGAVVKTSHIGLDTTGLISRPNVNRGIATSNEMISSILIGGKEKASRNIIGNNGAYGIYLAKSENAEIYNNFIGLAVDGVTPMSNANAAIHIREGNNITIGDSGFFGRNIIVSGTQNAIECIIGFNGVNIFNNYIGTDSSGLIQLPTGMGVILNGGTNVNIGGYGGRGNLILSDGDGINSEVGVVTVLGNSIGFASDGTNRSIGGTGIIQNNGATMNIGDGTDEGANSIGNAIGDGIEMTTGSTSILRNYIGTNALGQIAGNGNGIVIVSALGVSIKDSNVIANNLNAGISLSSAITNADINSNEVFNNGGLPHEGGEANFGYAAPVITGIGADSIISGTGITGTTVQIYADSTHEGQLILGTTPVIAGSWEFQLTSTMVAQINLYGLDSITAIQYDGTSSSPFSNSFYLGFPISAPSYVCARPSTGEVVLSWEDVSAPSGYHVIWTEDTINGPFVPEGTTTELADTVSLTNNTLYYLAVVSVGGDTSNWTGAVPVIEAGNALSFDGNTSGSSATRVVTEITDVGGNSFTSMAWVKMNSYPTGFNQIFSKWSPGWINSDFSAGYRSDKDSLYFGVSSGTLNVPGFDIFAPKPELDEWVHFAVSYNGSDLNLYLNGRLSGSGTFVRDSLSFPLVSRFIIGQQEDLATERGWDGEIDEVALFDNVLDVSTINNYKDTPLSGQETGLLGLWHFDESTGNIAYDASCNGNLGEKVGALISNPSKAMHPFSPDTLIVTRNCGEDSIQLAWSPNVAVDIETYLIYRDVVPTIDTNILVPTSLSGADTTFKDGNSLVTGTTYYYQVAGVDSAGQIGVLSEVASILYNSIDTALTQLTVADPCTAPGNDTLIVNMPTDSIVWYASIDGTNFIKLDIIVNDTVLVDTAGFYYARIYSGSCYDTTRVVQVDRGTIPVDLTSNLISHYSFDGNINDQSTNGNHLTGGTPEYVTGLFGQAIRFDGTGTTTLESSLSFTGDIQGAVSVSFWVGLDETATGVPFEIWENQNSRFEHVDFTTGSQIMGTYTRNNVTTSLNGDMSNYLTGEYNWAHITAVYDKPGTNELRVYVNGIRRYMGIVDGDQPVRIQNIIFGEKKDGTLSFSGVIDEFKVYQRVLTDREVEVLGRNWVPDSVSACGTSEILTASSISATNPYPQYNWIQPDLTQGSTTEDQVLDQSGYYNLTVDIDVCNSYDDSVFVTLQTVSDTIFAIGDTSYCSGDSIYIATTADADSILWLLDGVASGMMHSDTGSYVKDTSGTISFVKYYGSCFDTTQSVTINELQPTDITLNISSDTTNCYGSLITFNLAEDNDSIYWYLTSDALTPIGNDSAVTILGDVIVVDSVYAIVGSGTCADTTQKVQITTYEMDTVLVYADTLIGGTSDTIYSSTNSVVEWFYNGTSIGSDTAVDVTQAGEYYFVHDNGTCIGVSDTVEFTLDVCDPLVVTKTEDDGTCGTLRAAVHFANANKADDNIIVLSSTISSPIVLDDSLFIVDGKLRIYGNDNTIEANSLVTWSGNKKLLHVLADSFYLSSVNLVGATGIASGIYTDQNYSTVVLDSIAVESFEYGVQVAGTNNLISNSYFYNNSIVGLNTYGSNSKVILSSFGIDKLGTDYPSTSTNLFIGGSGNASGFIIGGSNVLDGNYFVNGNYGIEVLNGSSDVLIAGNIITQNNIGIKITGFLTNSVKVGTFDFESDSANIIALNTSHGIEIASAEDNYIVGNAIVQNGGNGMNVTSGMNNNFMINTISENTGKGINVGLGAQNGTYPVVIEDLLNLELSGSGASTGDTILIYGDVENEGSKLLGFTLATGDKWTYTLTSDNVDTLLVNGLDSLTALLHSNGNTAEFSNAWYFENICSPEFSLGLPDTLRLCGDDTLVQYTLEANELISWTLTTPTGAELSNADTLEVDNVGQWYFATLDSLSCVAIDSFYFESAEDLEDGIDYLTGDNNLANGDVTLFTDPDASTTIEWYEINDNTTVLGTSNTLVLSTPDIGEYYFKRSTNSCSVTSDTLEVIESSSCYGLSIPTDATISHSAVGGSISISNVGGEKRIDFSTDTVNDNHVEILLNDLVDITGNGILTVRLRSTDSVVVGVQLFDGINQTLSEDGAIFSYSSTYQEFRIDYAGAQGFPGTVDETAITSLLFIEPKVLTKGVVNTSFFIDSIFFQPSIPMNLPVYDEVCKSPYLLSANYPGADSYVWREVIANNTLSETTESVSLSNTGYYEVTVTKDNCIAVDRTLLEIHELDNELLSSGTALCVGATVQLYAAFQDYEYIEWYNSTNQLVGVDDTLEVITPGDYYFLKTSGGCIITSNYVTITSIVAADTSLTITGSNPLCFGDTITFNAAPNSSFEWFTSSGTTGNITDTYEYVGNVAGTEDVWVELGSGVCAGTSRVVSVETLAELDKSITASSTQVPFGGSVDVMAPTGGTFEWYNASTNTLETSSTSETLTVTIAGDYYYVRTLNGCIVVSDTINITSDGNTIDPGVIGNDQFICAGEIPQALISIQDATSTTGAIVYSWIQSSNEIVWADINGENSSVFAPGALTQNTFYRRIATSGLIADTSNSVKISIVTGAIDKTLEVNASSTNVCNGQDITVELPVTEVGVSYQVVVGSTAVGIQIVGNGNALSIPVANSDLSVGDNNIKVLATTGSGQCTASDTLDEKETVTVQSGVAPVVTPSVAKLCAGSTTILNVIDDPSATYQWYIDNDKLVGETNATVSAYIEGSYTVNVTSAGCGGLSAPVVVGFDDVNAVIPTIGAFGTSTQILEAKEQGVGYTYQWYVDYKGKRLAIVGATGVTYTPIYNGQYYVTINSAGTYCTRVSLNYSVTSQTTTISNVRLSTTDNSIYIPVENIAASSLDVLPNPAFEDITVYYRSSTIGEIHIELLNMNGVTIVDQTVNKMGYEITLPIKGLDQLVNAGIYIVRVTEGNLVEYTKVVIE